MCLILMALDQHPAFPLVIAANRDEFHARPSDVMHWWETPTGIPMLAGRDLSAGGTWLGLTRRGRIAAVTNVRSGLPEQARYSRGELTTRFLSCNASATDYAYAIRGEADAYAGFNLLIRDEHGWIYTSNRDSVPLRHLHRGNFGLSNHQLQTTWPKVSFGRARLRQILQDLPPSTSDSIAQSLHDHLLHALQHDHEAPDHLLPDTGVGLATERMLSPPFIKGIHYGTRASTVITQDVNGHIRVTEQNWGPNHTRLGTLNFDWR